MEGPAAGPAGAFVVLLISSYYWGSIHAPSLPGDYVSLSVLNKERFTPYIISIMR